MLMDSATDFGGKYTPSDADNLERGPVRVRNALQFSLNIPSVKATAVNGVDHVFEKAKDFGMQFQSETSEAELALGLGVQEVRPVDLVNAYSTLANGGRNIGHTTILTVQDADGKDVLPPYEPPKGEQAVSEQAAWIVTNILAGNTNPNVNPYWGKFAIEGPDGRRPATLKTGTNNDAKDLNAYGYIAPPTEEGRADGAYALAVGVWNGNSDNTPVSTPARPVFSIDVATYVWQGFLEEASKKWPETNFKRPGGSSASRSTRGPACGSGGGEVVNEWFINGTAPRDSVPKDTCGIEVVRIVGIEPGHDAWMKANENWIKRAEKGPVAAAARTGPGPRTSTTAPSSRTARRGAPWSSATAVASRRRPRRASRSRRRTPSGVIPSVEPTPTPDGSAETAAVPCPTPVPSETPSETPPPSETPTPEPTPEPTAEPTPEPTPTPTPEPTPTPTPEPTPTPTPAP